MIQREFDEIRQVFLILNERNMIPGGYSLQMCQEDARELWLDVVGTVPKIYFCRDPACSSKQYRNAKIHVLSRETVDAYYNKAA